MPDCGAKIRKGGSCRQQGMRNGRCRMHGGLTPAGIASPNFKTGRYSKYIPARLLKRYAEGESDSTLMDLRDEIALTDTRISDLLGRADLGDSVELWERLRTQLARHDAGDTSAHAECKRLVEKGIADHHTWDALPPLIEQRRKLVESEAKRLKDMRLMITAEQVMTFVATLSAIVKAHVKDEEILANISRDLIGLTTREPG